jgi:hypothetical protein
MQRGSGKNGSVHRPRSTNFAGGERMMSTIEQEIKTLAQKIWPDMHIEIGVK